jgi:hypothetical protein
MEQITILKGLIKKYIRYKKFLASSLHLYSFQGLSSSCCSNKRGFYYVGSIPGMEFGMVFYFIPLDIVSSLA